MIRHLSNSSITTYAMCPRRWKFHYVDKIAVPTATNLVFGVAFHETVESSVKDNHQGAPLHERWQHYWKTAVDNQRQVKWGRDSYESLLNLGLRMFRNPPLVEHVHNLQAGIDTRGTPKIERYFEIPLPDVDVPLVGYIDIVHPDGVPGDFKTSSKPWNPDKAMLETQPVLYLLALETLDARVDMRFRHHVYIKKTHIGVTIESEFEQKHLDWALHNVQQVWRGIKAGSFPAGSNMSWWCSPKWCEYWNHCGRV